MGFIETIEANLNKAKNELNKSNVSEALVEITSHPNILRLVNLKGQIDNLSKGLADARDFKHMGAKLFKIDLCLEDIKDIKKSLK